MVDRCGLSINSQTKKTIQFNYKLINDLKLAYKKAALQHHYCKAAFLDNASSITVSN